MQKRKQIQNKTIHGNNNAITVAKNEINYFKKIDPLNIIKKKSNYFSKKFKLIDSEVSNYFTISSKKKFGYPIISR